MPSRADARRAIEWALRAAMLATLAVAWWRSAPRASDASLVVATSASTLDRDLPRFIAFPATSALDLDANTSLTGAQRASLVALRRAGTTVRWHGAPPSVALEALHERGPDARTRIMIASGDSSPLVLADSAGAIDTVRARGGATIDAGTVVAPVRVTLGAFAASTLVNDEVRPRAVMVLSRAGWEAKFVMSALTEAGWVVRARLPAAPGVDVRDDALLPLDTARYDAIVALDSSAADFAPAIVRFVSQGGGLIAVGSALSVGSLHSVAPAQPGGRLAGRILLADDTMTPPDLPVRPLNTLRPDALVLEKEPAGVTLAARRAGMGRVIAVGYDESWRWRMLGGTSGVAAHRDWWSRAAASVSPEREARTAPSNSDAAPLAALIDALGPPSAAAPQRRPLASHTLPIAPLLIIIAALLAEIGSRRFRGAP